MSGDGEQTKSANEKQAFSGDSQKGLSNLLSAVMAEDDVQSGFTD